MKQLMGSQKQNAAVRRLVHIGKAAAANFQAWYERNFVVQRAGRIGCLSYTRAGSFDDHPGDWAWYSDAYGRAFYDHTEPLTPDEEDYIRSHPLVMFQLALGVTDLRGLRCMRRGLTLRVNQLQRKAYRSKYYAKENVRRRQFAAERRKIRKRATTNPCPTPDEFRTAFSRVGESVKAKLLFGGMVHDLACYVDSCLRYDANGNIAGRNGGIKAWLADNVPELYPRYKTIMRYKALAMRLRQAMEIKDPTPTSVLLEEEAQDGTKTQPNRNTTQTHAERKEGATGRKNYSAQYSHYWHGKRLLMRKIMADCQNTFRDAFGKIDSMLGGTYLVSTSELRTPARHIRTRPGQAPS